jgi:hypothetical protein
MTPWLRHLIRAGLLLPFLVAPLPAQTGVDLTDSLRVEIRTLLQVGTESSRTSHPRANGANTSAPQSRPTRGQRAVPLSGMAAARWTGRGCA